MINHLRDYIRHFFVSRRASATCLIALCTVACAFAGVASIGVAVAPASESASYVFDATMSLTGDCSTSTVDPIADPGCPGGSHPPKAFRLTRGVAVDGYGDRYVVSEGKEGGTEGRIDVFSAKGEYITEILDAERPQEIAVDGEGNLYVGQKDTKNGLVRYSPSIYKPQNGEIAYAGPIVVLDLESLSGELKLSYFSESKGVAVNPLNGHVFLDIGGEGNSILEFGSAAEGNPLINEKIASHEVHNSSYVALDGSRNRLYAITYRDKLEVGVADPAVVKVFELEPPHHLVATYESSNTPLGEFLSDTSSLPIAVDEESGDYFVGDLGIAEPRLYEFAQDGSYVSTIAREGMKPLRGQMAVNNGQSNATSGYLFVPSGEGSIGHSLAFAPNLSKPPVVESAFVKGVGEHEAVLRASVDPNGESTTYRIEYVSQQRFEEDGFASASLAGEGTIPPSSEGVPVGAGVTALAAGTIYHVRVSAENEDGEAQEQVVFSTYRLLDPSLGCENRTLRVGAAANLPDCRAYELVTPSDTDGRAPGGVDQAISRTATREVSPVGDRLSFRIQGGALPGLNGTGALWGDPYLASRTEAGWVTSSVGPTGSEASSISPTSHSPDQRFSFFEAEGSGSALVNEESTEYLRYPDGHFELVGRGDLGTDPHAQGDLIAEDGRHVIFVSGANGHLPVQLEEDAPGGTQTVYDRTIDLASGEERTHVVSLLPGDVTPATKEAANYAGASADGEGVAFMIEKTLYLRYRDSETFKVGEGVTFEGVAEGGGRVFYLKGGNLEAFDVASEGTIAFSASGDVTVVNLSADGSTAYFISPSALASEPNPAGSLPVTGGENLYRSREGQIAFVGTVTEGDLGEIAAFKPGLGTWTGVLDTGRLGWESSRTTPDGGVLLFQASSDLTGYDPQGHSEVYRYDASRGELACLSCNPTLAPATGQARLQTFGLESYGVEIPLGASDVVENLRADGRRAFFESTEALVPTDTDGVQDVYEWEQQGVGSCRTAGGCVYLISSGDSTHDNYLYGVSASGDDVFIETVDMLNGEDPSDAPSIYDARVNGGFAAPSKSGECLGEACQPTAAPPVETTPASWVFQGHGNAPAAAPKKKPSAKKKSVCPKGKRRTVTRGKQRCVASRKSRLRHRRRSNFKGRGH